LDGQLRPVSGTLSIAIACQSDQHQLILPGPNAQEACQLPDFKVFAANHLKEVCEHLSQAQRLPQIEASPLNTDHFYKFDLADVKGQLRPRRGLEIAAAGGHSLLFRGPPGTGKTLLASRLA
ncbi:magnesium chelatase, partial [Yersinia pestis]